MRTAIETTDPHEVIDAIGRLQAGVRKTVAAEAALMKTKGEKLSALWREGQGRSEAEAARLEARMLVLKEQYREAISAAETAREMRLAAIQRAYHSSKTALAKVVQGKKDRRIGQVQGAIMRNRQERQKQLEDATEHHRQFIAQVLAGRSERRKLRASLLSSIRSFRPMLGDWFDARRAKFDEVEISGLPEKNYQQCKAYLAEAEEAIDAISRMPLVKGFRYLPLWVITLAGAALFLAFAFQAGGDAFKSGLPWYLGGMLVVMLLWLAGFFGSRASIHKAAESLAAAAKLELAAENQSTRAHADLTKEIEDEEALEKRNLSETFRESDEEWRARLAAGQRRLDRIKAQYDAAIHQAREEGITRAADYESGVHQVKAAIDAETEVAMTHLADSWQAEVASAAGRLLEMDQFSKSRFPAWTSSQCAGWEAPADAPDALRIGSVQIDAAKLAGGLPGDARFQLPESGRIEAPLSLSFPAAGSILLETDGSDDGASTRALNAMALRLIASHPPGRASFVFIDPVGLGKDFAGLMHLADYEETLIHHRIWTQSTHIEERLAELNDHIEKVIQMYLRDEYDHIADYNAQAGMIAEKYRFVVIAGFPSAFSEISAKRLLAIASSGARCGVHLLIQRDTRLPIPDPALEDELRRNCLHVIYRKSAFHLAANPPGADQVVFDEAPSHRDSMELVHRIGRASVDSNRVQVPFSQIAPPVDEIWKSSTSEELRVPIGRTGARKLQMLCIGKGTRQHALVAGKTGSGKSTLFHVIITNLALWCSPDEVEFYLVDFKKGVEFKCYASKRLPHARVVAIESDREFALSVLQRVDAELKRRGELFRQAGAQDVAGYLRSCPGEVMPRSLLLIDEFQEFFTEDDSVAQEASLLLDRIVRQGRAFGIHVILGSQTLGGAYTLARATLGQMVIRIALQCNETDAHLIMDDDNPAPRMLTRPGEGIYNDQAGALAANSPFQIVWLPEQERDAVLDEINARAASIAKLPPPPVVFEGNAPADLADNIELATAWKSKPSTQPNAARAWLGAPNSIKGPTEAVFRRQSGNHLLVVGQSAERTASLLGISLLSLAAQYPADQAEFIILDPRADDIPSGREGDLFHRLAAMLPHPIRFGSPMQAGEIMTSLASELSSRAETAGREAPAIYVIIHDLQRFRSLRPDDEFLFSMDDSAAVSPSKVFAELLGEGSSSGIHVIASTDTWNNVSRWIPRKSLAEFGMRVLFQMSANDSANLIDSPAASTLGLHRALFHNEQLGSQETFRPYATPDPAWIGKLASAKD